MTTHEAYTLSKIHNIPDAFRAFERQMDRIGELHEQIDLIKRTAKLHFMVSVKDAQDLKWAKAQDNVIATSRL